MSDVINLPDNFIPKPDRERLESFGGHTISRGRATRWHWDKSEEGGDEFFIFRGGAKEVLAARISRDRDADAYCAFDARNKRLSTGPLDHIMADLDAYFVRLHGEQPGPA